MLFLLWPLTLVLLVAGQVSLLIGHLALIVAVATVAAEAGLILRARGQTPETGPSPTGP